MMNGGPTALDCQLPIADCRLRRSVSVPMRDAASTVPQLAIANWKLAMTFSWRRLHVGSGFEEILVSGQAETGQLVGDGAAGHGAINQAAIADFTAGQNRPAEDEPQIVEVDLKITHYHRV